MTGQQEFYVYVIHDSTGVPVYVGKGRRRRSGLSGRRNRKISALISFGGTLPPVKVRTGLTEAEAYECERALIAFHGRADLGLGSLLNLCDGGAGASNPTAETRAKLVESNRSRVITAATRAKLAEAACNCSPETRAKLAEAACNRSIEYRKKIAAANRRRVVTAATRAKQAEASRNCSAETRARMSAAKTGRPLSPDSIAKREATKRANRVTNAA